MNDKILLCLSVILFAVSCSRPGPDGHTSVPPGKREKTVYAAPDTSELGNSKWDSLVRYGARLVRHSAYYIGPQGVVSHNLKNKMNCTNCHLDVGTRPDGLNFFHTHKSYPQYRAREDKVLSLADRVNNCITRPHSGTELALDSREMLAIISYIKWIGEKYDTAVHVGYSLHQDEFYAMKANVQNGKSVYEAECATCHGQDGAGKMKYDGSTYEYPPLWGEQSYQEGSSMHRGLKAASFIFHNMPNLKAFPGKPYLSRQQALDVAAFINDNSIHPRPRSKYVSYPNVKTKPVDYFRGPYVDDFSEEQHTFGPWDEIVSYRRTLGLPAN